MKREAEPVDVKRALIAQRMRGIPVIFDIDERLRLVERFDTAEELPVSLPVRLQHVVEGLAREALQPWSAFTGGRAAARSRSTASVAWTLYN